MGAVEQLAEKLGDYAKDLRLNLQAVLDSSSLTPAQTWGTAVAVAMATRNSSLLAAVQADGALCVEASTWPAVLDDARAAAALMGMNNIFYRFRHMMGDTKPVYGTLPAQLRMNRIARPTSNRLDFELFCLAVSAVHGCEMCVMSHEKTVTDGGVTEQQVHNTVRIAATLHGVAVALAATAQA